MRPAFSHVATFMWFSTIVFGMMVRPDVLGVTSIVRGLNLRRNCYASLRKFFHSDAIELDQLVVLWARTVLL